jgi:Abnormal spindle-like microcephaly-assoc'd, ASPM-SPD-2-Hydin/Immunoglobulin I-set domain
VQIVKKTLAASLFTLILLAVASPAHAKTAVNSQSCVLSSGKWVNSLLTQVETRSFRITYDATASSSKVDAVTGLSSGSASDFSNLAAVIRFNSSGAIDARNGSTYTAASVISYSGRVTYRFILDVNISTHSYNAYVMIGSVQTTIGTNLAFRSEQANAATLNNVGAMTAPGTSTVCNITLSNSMVAPAITTQPNSAAVTAGQTASFSIATTGTAPLTFQWKKNGAAISGATSSNYSTPVATITDNGEQFTAVVSNNAGTATSSAAVLTVTAPVVAPSISTQPVSQTLTVGQSATFSVFATGTGPLSYQWSRNGAAISGAVSSSYTIATTATSDNGAQFNVLVSNNAGVATSNAATLTVKAAIIAPSITLQPLAQAVTAGQAATFSVATTGTAPMTYQWSRNATQIIGANSSSYTTALTTSSDNGAQFSVLVSNSAGNATSIPAALTVNAAGLAPGCLLSSGTWVNSPLTQAQTSSFRIVFDATPSTSAVDAVTGLSSGAASAYQNLAVIVRFNSGGTIDAINGAGYTTAPAIPYSAATTYHFILDVNIGTHTYDAYVLIGSAQTSIGTGLAFRAEQAAITTLNSLGAMTSTGSDTICNIATSAPAATAPSITAQPISRTVSAGQTATFSVTASGTATLTYQWMKDGAAVNGAISASYTTPATAASDNGAQFTVAVSNAAGTITSSPVSLTVSAAATLMLSSSTSSLNFGSVNVPNSSAQNVTLTNAGNSNVTISQVLVAGAGFNTTNASGMILSPGQSTTLTSTFAPSATGPASGKITVSSNATNSPSNIALSGTGVAAVTHTVTLSWGATASGVTGFNTYSSTVSGGPYAKLTSAPLTNPSYTDTSVQSGRTYYYVVTAVNSSSQESAYSSEVTAIVP